MTTRAKLGRKRMKRVSGSVDESKQLVTFKLPREITYPKTLNAKKFNLMKISVKLIM